MTKHKTPRKHSFTTTQYEHPPSQRVKPPRKPLPGHLFRQWAMEGKSGGRMYCQYCRTYFEAAYVRLVKSGPFENKDACVDCVKEHQLTVIRK